MSEIQKKENDNSELSSQNQAEIITVQKLQSPTFLKKMLHELIEIINKRKVTVSDIVVYTRIKHQEVIDAVSIAISEADAETAASLFNYLDHMFKSEVLVKDGTDLNVSVFNKVEELYPSELPKYFMYHYKKVVQSLYTFKFTEISGEFIENFVNFVNQMPVLIRKDIFKEMNIKMIYLIAVFEISWVNGGNKSEEQELYNLIRGHHIIPIDFNFLFLLQEIAPDRYDELCRELLNSDWEFLRNIFYEGHGFEEYNEAMGSFDKDSSSGSMGEIFTK